MNITERRLEDLSRKGRYYLLKQCMAYWEDMPHWDRPDDEDLFVECDKILTSNSYTIGCFVDENGPSLLELENDDEMWRYDLYAVKVKVTSWYSIPIRARSKEQAISAALDDKSLFDGAIPYSVDYDFDPEEEEE